MTDDEVHAEIGKLVACYHDTLRRHAALRTKIGRGIASMRKIVDPALAGGHLSVRAISREAVPADDWSELGGLLDEFDACRAALEVLEGDLRSAQLGDLIQRVPT